jgi:hypothetical protein
MILSLQALQLSHQMTFFTSSPSAGEGRPEFCLRQSAPKGSEGEERAGWNRTIFASGAIKPTAKLRKMHTATQQRCPTYRLGIRRRETSCERRGSWPCRPLSQNQCKTATDSGEIPRTEALLLRFWSTMTKRSPSGYSERPTCKQNRAYFSWPI